jgi:hypothetical protein
MARVKSKYRGPRKMMAAMSVASKIKSKKINKYIYAVHHLLDGRSVKKRRLNPEYAAINMTMG